MEPFLDFGLFELLAASLLAWCARKVYSRRDLALVFLTVTVVSPAILLIVGASVPLRGVAIVCLVTALVNAAALFHLVRAGRLFTLLAKPKNHQRSRGRAAEVEGP